MSPSTIIGILSIANAMSLFVIGWLLHIINGIRADVVTLGGEIRAVKTEVSPDHGLSLSERVKHAEIGIAVLEANWRKRQP